MKLSNYGEEAKLDRKKVVELFEEVVALMEIKGENPFKIRAYANAARTLELLNSSLEDYVKEDKLDEIKGIGKAISENIKELYSTEKLEMYENLRSSIPEGIFDILKIPGVGPKKVKILYEKLGIKSVGELEYACIENRLVELEGFGVKTQANILKGIELLKKFKGQFLFGDVYFDAVAVRENIIKSGLAIECEIAGSLRRKKEIVKDIDIVASSNNPKELMEFFSKLDAIEEVTEFGDTKSSAVMKNGMKIDIRVVKEAEFPYVLNHFTGSKEHNTAIRHRAKSMDIKVNEYGLFRGEEFINCKNEEEIYKTLGLSYIPPELRENSGEIEAAEKNTLPKLVEYSDIVGIFHMHTVYSDGSNTITEMAEKAKKMGFKYIGITDHSQTAVYAKGLLPDTIKRQIEEIDIINSNDSSFKIYKGIESDILPDGSLDYDDEVLAKFDFVIASVHSAFKMEKDKMTERLVNALKNKHTTMLGHMTGRILLARAEYNLDIEQVIDAAAMYNKIIEINSDYHRLDIDWRYIRYAKEKGVRFAINPDAHSTEGMNNTYFGVGIARKGWLSKSDVINTYSIEEMNKFLIEVKK